MKQQYDLDQCDTLIIGSSMAGGCLARQLKLKHPSMKITVLERKKEFDHWVGESTLESFWDYAVKCLDLGFYLDTNHLYKHGLRFFYDSPEHDLPIDQMSEVGRSWFHSTPAHQIDRKRFDTDLYKMNLESGIDVHLGTKVTNIEIDSKNGHRIFTKNKIYQCRWLVDAAGLASPIGRKLGLIKSNKKSHPINSYWARVKNIANLDLLGDMQWRSKVNHTTRTLATTHFMYGGYWIWLIPINSETFSIGLTVRTDMADVQIKSQEDFLKFLKTHKCMRQLLHQGCEVIDFQKMANISRQSEQSFSNQRWFMTGMSAAILDPILSPGSALLADHNRMIGDLIEADMNSEKTVFENKIKAYNAYSKMWQKNFFLHIKGHYHDCYDRQRAIFETLLIQWFGVVLPISMSQSWGYDPNMSDEEFDQLEQKNDEMMANSVIHKVETVIEQLHHYLREKKLEYVNNKGQFYDIEIGDKAMRNTRTFGKNLNFEEIIRVENHMLMIAVKQSLIRMLEIEKLECSKELLNEIIFSVTSDNLNLRQGLNLIACRSESNVKLSLKDNAA